MRSAIKQWSCIFIETKAAVLQWESNAEAEGVSSAEIVKVAKALSEIRQRF